MFLGTVAANTGPGPAPNSGDGVPDGSGFEPTLFTVELGLILLILTGLSLTFFLFKIRNKKQKPASFLAQVKLNSAMV